MNNKLNKIIKILFSYQTDNVDKKTNQNILLCQKEIRDFLVSEGVNCELDFYSLNKDNKKHANLIAFDKTATGPFVLLQGHIDTIPSLSAFKTVINSKEIRGRGAVDMKGPLAGIIDAYLKIYHKKDLSYSPILLITTDEEANSFAGILNFIKTHKNILNKIKFAINGEPTNFSVYTGFRGIYGCIIEAKAKEGHSAYPDNETIIEKMIPLISSIGKFIKIVKKIKDKELGNTIGAFTVLNSGHKISKLPGNFLAGFSLRTVKTPKHYETIFEKMVKKFIPKGSKIKKISIAPVAVKLEHKQKEALKKAFLKSDKKYNKEISRYFSEANILNKEGIKTITCGPGNPKLAHVDPKDEVIKISDIKKYSKLLQNILSNLK